MHCSGSLSPNHFILRDLQSTPVRWKGAESENLDYLDTSMYSFTVWCSRATIKSTPRLREPEERENRDALALQPGPDMKSEEGPQKLLGADIGSLLLTITRVLSYSILFSTLFVVIYYSKA